MTENFDFAITLIGKALENKAGAWIKGC